MGSPSIRRFRRRTAVSGKMAEAVGLALHEMERTLAVVDAALAAEIFPAATAAALHASIDEVASHFRHALASAELQAAVSKRLGHALVDLETLAELANVAAVYDMTPVNALHLARAIRYTAQSTADALGAIASAIEGPAERG